MTLNNKLAFEIWVGIVILVIGIGGIAGVTLMLNNEATSSIIPLIQTQANNPARSTPVPSPAFASEGDINAAASIMGALLGGE